MFTDFWGIYPEGGLLDHLHSLLTVMGEPHFNLLYSHLPSIFSVVK